MFCFCSFLAGLVVLRCPHHLKFAFQHGSWCCWCGVLHLGFASACAIGQKHVWIAMSCGPHGADGCSKEGLDIGNK